MILTMLPFVIYVRKFYQFNTFKVRDHDHLTGKFCGASHQNEDINYFNNRYLPVSFTIKKTYDGHLIIRAAFKINQQGE